MCRIPYDWRGDPELAHAMAERGGDHGTWVTAIDDTYLPIYYATLNLWKFLGEGLDRRWVSVSVAQTGVTEDFLRAGRALGDAIARTDRKVLLLASGALSHTFWKLRELRDHEASDATHIRTPEAYAADQERIAWFKAGDHARVLDTMDDFLRYRPESMFAHYLLMIGALGEGDCRAPGRQYGDYENSIGTGQVHLWFDRPDGGFPAPRRTPPDAEYLRQTGGPDLTAAG
jgi:aromatic ring-opening dioxygenase catalytic subunit (LigB family)